MSYVSLPEIAAKIAEWFPDLNGRSFAVSDDDIGAATTPTLPLAMVASNEIGSTRSNIKTSSKPELYDDFVVEFWLKIERHKVSGQSESPFFAYYDYITILRRLFYRLRQWGWDISTQFEFMSCTPSSYEQAVILTYRFRQHFCLLEPEDMEQEPIMAIIKPRICEN